MYILSQPEFDAIYNNRLNIIKYAREKADSTIFTVVVKLARLNKNDARILVNRYHSLFVELLIDLDLFPTANTATPTGQPKPHLPIGDSPCTPPTQLDIFSE
jgi:hypothetical protein